MYFFCFVVGCGGGGGGGCGSIGCVVGWSGCGWCECCDDSCGCGFNWDLVKRRCDCCSCSWGWELLFGWSRFDACEVGCGFSSVCGCGCMLFRLINFSNSVSVIFIGYSFFRKMFFRFSVSSSLSTSSLHIFHILSRRHLIRYIF